MLITLQKYQVMVGWNHYRYFVTLDAAKAFCNAIFQRTNIVLAIEPVVHAFN